MDASKAFIHRLLTSEGPSPTSDDALPQNTRSALSVEALEAQQRHLLMSGSAHAGETAAAEAPVLDCPADALRGIERPKQARHTG